MSGRLQLELANDVGELARLVREVDAFVAQHRIAAGPAYSMHLALEEVVTNVIKYGHDDESQHVIRVSIAIAESAVELVIEDDGDAFDPTAAPAPVLGGAIDDREVGGLGLHLVRQIASDLRYERLAGRNRVAVKIDLRASD